MKKITLQGKPVECGAKLIQIAIEQPLLAMAAQEPDVADAIFYGALSRLTALAGANCGMPRTIQLLEMARKATEEVMLSMQSGAEAPGKDQVH